jgi:YD repeat-containing protein
VSQDTSFDANGNMTVYYGFNQVMTCFANDTARNLETARIEGLASSTYCASYLTAASLPEPARKTSTQWHPSLRLPAKKAEPKLITSFVYDSNGNVLSKTEQPTSDGTGVLGFNASPIGAARTWTYTYNQIGQVLTATGPRTDVSDVTRYSYDSSGNLTQITNPANHVTQLSNYDPNGRPGRIVDPNGVISDISYTWRGAPAAVTVGGETTSYSYDGAGKLLQVVYPTGATLTYTYDAAGRQTGVFDSVGNSIAYTLDALGNRTSEQVRDSTGVLARQVSRSYDVLNRVKQVTGAQQ